MANSFVKLGSYIGSMINGKDLMPMIRDDINTKLGTQLSENIRLRNVSIFSDDDDVYTINGFDFSIRNGSFSSAMIGGNIDNILVAVNPAVINDSMTLIREWGPGTTDNPVTWTKDVDVRQRNGIPYKCNQTHTHHGEPGWGPGENDALWSEYHGTSPETARPYKQPLGAHDAYRVDEYAIKSGKVYRCKADNTVYSPSVLPINWEFIGVDPVPEEPTEPDNPDEPTPTLPQAWDDIPANHLFAVGDEFSDKGMVYAVLREFNKQEGWRPPTLTGSFYVANT